MNLSRSKAILFSFVFVFMALSNLVADTVNFPHINNVDESFWVVMHYQDGSSQSVYLNANYTTNVSVSKTVTGVTVNGTFVGAGTDADVTLSTSTQINVDFNTAGQVIYEAIDAEA